MIPHGFVWYDCDGMCCCDAMGKGNTWYDMAQYYVAQSLPPGMMFYGVMLVYGVWYDVTRHDDVVRNLSFDA